MTPGELSIGLKLANMDEWQAVAKHLQEEKDKALARLLNSQNEIEMYRLQGEIKTLDLLISLKTRFEKILKGMKNA